MRSLTKHAAVVTLCVAIGPPLGLILFSLVGALISGHPEGVIGLGFVAIFFLPFTILFFYWIAGVPALISGLCIAVIISFERSALRPLASFLAGACTTAVYVWAISRSNFGWQVAYARPPVSMPMRLPDLLVFGVIGGVSALCCFAIASRFTAETTVG